MKKVILVIIFISFTTVQLFAQRTDISRIEAFKTAFITNALDLSPSEAEKFWPIYNQYSKTIQEVKNKKGRELQQRMRAKGGLRNLTEKEATLMIQEILTIDANVLEAKRLLYKKLEDVVTPKKIIRLFKAEQDFNKELLKRFRQRNENLKTKK